MATGSTEGDHVTIPRLEEYYRAGPVVGWGEDIPEGWREVGPIRVVE